MINCPKCGGELSPAEVKTLWGEYTRSKRGDNLKKAVRENGKKGGRPRKPDAEITPAALKRRESREGKK